MIAIIGAGIAGLAAANRLLKNGISSIILEARNRVGGRILTDYSLGIPISLGPQWLHGLENNPIAKLADNLSLHYKKTEFVDLLWLNRDQKAISHASATSFFHEFEETLNLSKHYAQRQKENISLLDALNAVSHVEHLCTDEKDLYEVRKYALSLYTGASLKNLSASHWDEEEILPGGNHMLLEGFMPIADHLAGCCDIRFNTQVSKIIFNASNITMMTNQGDFIVEKVILTVPLGILKRSIIQFDPDLPSRKKIAIERLGMGILDSLVLKFSKIFWPQTCCGMVFSDPALDFRFFMNLNYFQQQPIITSRVAGEHAKMLEELNDKIWLEKAMKGLSQVFGKDIPAPENYLTVRWGKDKFSYGSYSYIAKEASGTEYDVLAEPIDNRLFFAGEATHRQYPGTVHGAYLSGIRAAEGVLHGLN